MPTIRPVDFAFHLFMRVCFHMAPDLRRPNSIDGIEHKYQFVHRFSRTFASTEIPTL